MSTCDYDGCGEPVVNGESKCILHLEVPEITDPDFERIMEAKKEKVKEIIESKIINFMGAELRENIVFDHLKINEEVVFDRANIDGDISFKNSEIQNKVSFVGTTCENVYFDGSKINNNVVFDGAHVNNNITLERALIIGSLNFNGLKNVQDIKMNRSQIGSIFGMRATIKGHMWAVGCEIENGSVHFENSNMDGSMFFERAKIGESLFLSPANIKGNVSFKGGVIEKTLHFFGLKEVKDLNFEGTKIGEDVYLGGAEIDRDVNFINANLRNLDFNRAIIGNNVNFDGAEIAGEAKFNTVNVSGQLTFEGTQFKNLKSQENACRTAKNVWENLGDRDIADHYFYREMEAKRKQKGKWKSKLEYIFIQKAFNYGTNPKRVIILWILFIMGFGLIYLILGYLGIYFGFKVIDGIDGSLWQVPDYFYFSVFTATGFDFVHYELKPEFQILASVEVVFGIFIWAAFLVIFARKYMR